jgi:AcrR family transcriptional regulator
MEINPPHWIKKGGITNLTSLKEKTTRPRIKKPVQKRSIETRNKIINTAKDLFAEKGFDATNTNLIASRSGLSVGSVYAHFTNKLEIFHTILENFSKEVFEYLRESIQKIIENQNSLNEAIDLLVHGLFEAHMLNGNLNAEMDKFILMDSTAGEIRSGWEEKTNQEILNLIKHFSKEMSIKDRNAAVTVIHRSIHEVFQYLYKNRHKVNEKAVLKEFVTMLQKYVA